MGCKINAGCLMNFLGKFYLPADLENTQFRVENAPHGGRSRFSNIHTEEVAFTRIHDPYLFLLCCSFHPHESWFDSGWHHIWDHRLELLNINGGCLGDSWVSKPRIHVHGMYRVRQSCVLELESIFSGRFSLHKRVTEWKSDKHVQRWCENRWKFKNPPETKILYISGGKK